MSAATLAAEATRYLEAIDVLRSAGLHVEWRSEASEVGVLSFPSDTQRPLRCERCAGRLVCLNGEPVCFRH